MFIFKKASHLSQKHYNPVHKKVVVTKKVEKPVEIVDTIPEVVEEKKTRTTKKAPVLKEEEKSEE